LYSKGMSGSRKRSSRSRQHRGRASRRSEEHRTAQAEAELTPAPDVPDHPLIPGNKPALIDSVEGLNELVEHVRSVGSFAYDTEFIGEETYHPVICVIQIATRDRVALVEPLGDLDLTPVWDLIADPDVETVVHAGQQDLEPVVRFIDRPPRNIFDTQIAAGFVDRPYPLGLRRLVQEFIGARLPKALTFTKWDQRPLSDVHARYAADDVRYLPAVRETLREQLEAHGHADWVAAECETLSEIARYRFDPDARVARLLSNRSLRPRNRAVLREIVIFRDQAAREHDVPPRTLLRDDVVMRLAKEPAKSVSRLETVKGLPWPVREEYGERIVAATQRALDLPADALPRGRVPDETPVDGVRIDGLWALAASYCRGRAVDPALVTNRREIARFYFAARNGGIEEGAHDLGLTQGWRYELVGSVLADVLAGRTTVELEWKRGRLQVTAPHRHASDDT
jgi:ribonuclease D